MQHVHRSHSPPPPAPAPAPAAAPLDVLAPSLLLAVPSSAEPNAVFICSSDSRHTFASLNSSQSLVHKSLMYAV